MHARNAIAGVARSCKSFPLKHQIISLLQTVYGTEASSPAKIGAISTLSGALTGKTFSIFSREAIIRHFSGFSAAKNPDPSENDEDFDNNYTQATSSIQEQHRRKKKSEIFSRYGAKRVDIGGPGFQSRVVKGEGKDKFRNLKNDSGKVNDKSSKRREKFTTKEIDREELEKKQERLSDSGKVKDKSWKLKEKFAKKEIEREELEERLNDSGKAKDKSSKRKEKFAKKEIDREELEEGLNDSGKAKDKSSKWKEKFAKKKIDWEELEKEGLNDFGKIKDKSLKSKEKFAKKEIDWEELENEEEELNQEMQNNYNIDELLPNYSLTERQRKAANVTKALATLKISHGNDNDASQNSSNFRFNNVNQNRNKEKEKLEKVKAKIANKLEEEEEEVQQSGKVSDDWFPQLSPEEKLRRSSRLAKSLLEASLEGPEDAEEEQEGYIRRAEQKSLTVGIVGPPNAGKSTLANIMVGKKVAAVSRKTNTTRHEILGVLTKGDTQILFFDTPGIGVNHAAHPAKTDIRQRFESSWSSVKLYDLLIVIVDAHRHLEKPDPRVIRLVNQMGQEVHPKQKRILCMNKVDLVKEKKDLLKVANEFGQLPGYDKFYMTSGIRGSGVKDLLKYFIEQAVRRPWDEVPWDKDPMALDEDILKSTALEVVREKMLHYIHQEIPYQIDHRLIDWREMEDGSLRIEQHFIVHKHTHRRILVGKHGSKIREIGMAANEELRLLFKRTIHLMIQVRLKN